MDPRWCPSMPLRSSEYHRNLDGQHRQLYYKPACLQNLLTLNVFTDYTKVTERRGQVKWLQARGKVDCPFAIGSGVNSVTHLITPQSPQLGASSRLHSTAPFGLLYSEDHPTQPWVQVSESSARPLPATGREPGGF